MKIIRVLYLILLFNPVFVKRAKSRKDYLSELLRVINKYNLPIEVFVVEE